MEYNRVTNLVICIRPVGPTDNFLGHFKILIENTSVAAKFEDRPIKMPPTPYFASVTTRGQRSIPRLTINATKGRYHSNGTRLGMYYTVSQHVTLQARLWLSERQQDNGIAFNSKT